MRNAGGTEEVKYRSVRRLLPVGACDADVCGPARGPGGAGAGPACPARRVSGASAVRLSGVRGPALRRPVSGSGWVRREARGAPRFTPTPSSLRTSGTGSLR